jgi:hypothetical protein
MTQDDIKSLNPTEILESKIASLDMQMQLNTFTVKTSFFSEFLNTIKRHKNQDHLRLFRPQVHSLCQALHTLLYNDPVVFASSKLWISLLFCSIILLNCRSGIRFQFLLCMYWRSSHVSTDLGKSLRIYLPYTLDLK